MLKFDSCIISCDGYNSLEFHTFADASTEAYVVVCFLRIVYQDEILVNFLFGKSQVWPANCDWTVPRMELIAASLAARIFNIFSQKLPVKFERTFFWSDSSAKLCLIRNSSCRVSVFVDGRLSEIRSLTPVSS